MSQEENEESEKPEPVRVLFVCMGNICRSPAAENVMRHYLDQQGLSHAFELDSAGTIRLHAGNAPDARMTAAAKSRGIPMSGRARQIVGADLENFDWVLVMDRENLADVHALARHHGRGQAQVALFCDFCDAEPDTEEVPDPYYGGPEGFERVLDLLEDGCRGLLRRHREGSLG